MLLTVNLTSLAAILWSGMLIIAGSIWVLSSQVRRLSDLLEQQGNASDREVGTARRAAGRPSDNPPGARVLRIVGGTRSRVN